MTSRTKRSATYGTTPHLPNLDLAWCACWQAMALPGAGAADDGSWWVRSSAAQVLDSTGAPAGFKHSLMWGRTVVKTGTGADASRRLRAEADFINRSLGLSTLTQSTTR